MRRSLTSSRVCSNSTGGKDASITWRHLASQTSGYGLGEAPGKAYAYNDSALALYYDTLMRAGLPAGRHPRL